MQYFIGTDIGTSAVKTVAFDGSGTVLAAASRAYPLLQTRPGYSEQDPESIFEAVTSSLREVLSALAPVTPDYVAFSAAMHSLIVLDEDEKLLTTCMTWADGRAANIAEALRNTVTGKKYYQLTGVPVHAMSPFCKILWLKEKAPDLFKKASRYIGIKEYVLKRLCGDYFTDSSMAAATGLMNGVTKQWDPEILAYAGISITQLSVIVPADQAFPFLQTRFIPELPAGTWMVAGASDGACATIGSGIRDATTMAVSIGTSGAARLLVKGFQTDPEMRTFCYHVKEDAYITGGATNNGAIVLNWLRDEILQRKNDFAVLLEEAAALPPGAEGLLFLPYLLGERAPLWNAQAKAVFFGLTTRHRSAHLVRAAMEGVCYGVYSIGRILEQQQQVREICASGGFTGNTAWVQMLADFFDLPVYTGITAETSALGAVMLADPAAIRLNETQNTLRFRPSAVNHSIYLSLSDRAAKLYAKLETDMQNTDEG